MNTNEIPAPESGELRTMSGQDDEPGLTFGEAWEIQRTVGPSLDHDPKCSSVPGWHPLSGPALLCDCGAMEREWKRRLDHPAPEELCDWCKTPMAIGLDSVGKPYRFCKTSHLHMHGITEFDPDQPAPAPSELSRSPLPLSERPTPRTDAVSIDVRPDFSWVESTSPFALVPSAFARTLERELAEKAEDNSRLAGMALDAKRELAEARESEASETRWAAQYKRERDDARERGQRLVTEKAHRIAQLEQDVAEAREQLDRTAVFSTDRSGKITITEAPETFICHRGALQGMIDRHNELIDVREQRDRLAEALDVAMARAYAAGYQHGHEDTVEAQFIPVHHSDVKDYFEDNVRQMLIDGSQPEAAAALAAVKGGQP